MDWRDAPFLERFLGPGLGPLRAGSRAPVVPPLHQVPPAFEEPPLGHLERVPALFHRAADGAAPGAPGATAVAAERQQLRELLVAAEAGREAGRQPQHGLVGRDDGPAHAVVVAAVGGDAALAGSRLAGRDGRQDPERRHPHPGWPGQRGRLPGGDVHAIPEQVTSTDASATPPLTAEGRPGLPAPRTSTSSPPS